MIHHIKYKIVYQYRFLPLFLSGILLLTSIFLKYVSKADVGSWFGWTIFLTILSFIYYRGVLETKKNRETKSELSLDPQPLSNKEVEKIYQAEMQDEKQHQIQNIIFRSFYLFISLCITLAGLSTFIFEKDLNYFGIAISILGALLSIYSILILKKWIHLYRYYKKEISRKLFDEVLNEEQE